MNDVGTGESKLKGVLDKLDGNPFFGFSRPYLNFIGKGTIFSLVYFIMAAISLILPFVVIFMVVNSGIFQAGGGGFVVAFIFSWFAIAFACWIGFQLWWNRRSQVSDVATSDFVAIPICAGIFRTFGEWLGTLIGIIGFVVGIIASIILSGDMAWWFFASMGLGFLGGLGPVVIIGGPVIGFFIIILFRLLAEGMMLLAALVNNTKTIAENIKNK